MYWVTCYRLHSVFIVIEGSWAGSSSSVTTDRWLRRMHDNRCKWLLLPPHLFPLLCGVNISDKLPPPSPVVCLLLRRSPLHQVHTIKSNDCQHCVTLGDIAKARFWIRSSSSACRAEYSLVHRQNTCNISHELLVGGWGVGGGLVHLQSLKRSLQKVLRTIASYSRMCQVAIICALMPDWQSLSSSLLFFSPAGFMIVQDTRYKIQETLFNVGLYTETLAQ